MREFLYLSLASAKQASDLGLEPDSLGGEPASFPTGLLRLLLSLRMGDTDSEGLALVLVVFVTKLCPTLLQPHGL